MLKNKIFLAITLGALALGAVFVKPVLAGPLDAATRNLNTAVQGTGLGETRIEKSIGTVVRAILSVVGTIFLLLTVYAGILWMTAQGAAEQIEKAQNIISAAIIGLFITMAAYAITSFVTGRLGNVGAGGPVAQGVPACASIDKSKGCLTLKNCGDIKESKTTPSADCPDPKAQGNDPRVCCIAP